MDKKEYMKQYLKQYRENNKKKIKQHKKQYYQTKQGKKSHTISSWKWRGLKEYGYTYNELYEYYLSITNCEVCKVKLNTNTKTKKCMDHEHTTGCFRWVLCHSCNCQDNWINEIVKPP